MCVNHDGMKVLFSWLMLNVLLVFVLDYKDVCLVEESGVRKEWKVEEKENERGESEENVLEGKENMLKRKENGVKEKNNVLEKKENWK